MEIITFLTQEKDLMEKLLLCLQKEKQALIEEDAKSLLEIIQDKEKLMDSLDQVDTKRKELYPEVSISTLKESGLLNEELQLLADQLRDLVEGISQLQITNRALTQQALEYSQQMISILRGSNNQNTPSYGANGKIETAPGKGNTVVDHSV